MDIAKNKQIKTYDYISRYAGIYYYYNTSDNKYMYGLTKQTDTTDEKNSYVLHDVKENETLDSLALKYYGRPDFFWIIADYNRITDCFINLWDEGIKTLRIPVLSLLKYNFKTKD